MMLIILCTLRMCEFKQDYENRIAPKWLFVDDNLIVNNSLIKSPQPFQKLSSFLLFYFYLFNTLSENNNGSRSSTAKRFLFT